MCLKDSSNNICPQHTLKFLTGIIYPPLVFFWGGGEGCHQFSANLMNILCFDVRFAHNGTVHLDV